MSWHACSTSSATMGQTQRLLSHISSNWSIPSSATSICTRSTTSDAPTTPSSSMCSRCWRSLRSPPSSYRMRWSESTATKSCDSGIASKAMAVRLANKEPTHQDSPTRWNSTHEMCTDASGPVCGRHWPRRSPWPGMACHRWRVDVPSRVAPSHGEPCEWSQVNARPSADVRFSAPEALQRQRTAAAGDRRQANGDRNEGEAQEVQKQAGARTGDHCGVPEPIDPQADRPGGVEAHRWSRSKFATMPLLGWGEISPKHRTGSGWQLAFHRNVSIAAQRRWQWRRGRPVFVDRHRPVIEVHQRLVVVVSPEGIVVGPLLDGHGLPQNISDIDAIRAGQQRRQSQIHMHPAVAIIINVHHNNVPAFMDECRSPQNAGELSAGDGCPRTRRRQQRGVDRPGAWGGARGLGQGDPWRWCRSNAPQPVRRPSLWGQPWSLSEMSHGIRFKHFYRVITRLKG